MKTTNVQEWKFFYSSTQRHLTSTQFILHCVVHFVSINGAELFLRYKILSRYISTGWVAFIFPCHVWVIQFYYDKLFIRNIMGDRVCSSSCHPYLSTCPDSFANTDSHFFFFCYRKSSCLGLLTWIIYVVAIHHLLTRSLQIVLMKACMREKTSEGIPRLVKYDAKKSHSKIGINYKCLPYACFYRLNVLGSIL